MNFGGAPQSFWSRFGEPERPHFSGRDELGHGADSLLNWNFRIDAVLIEEIDGFDAQPLETGVTSAPNIFRRAVNAPSAVGMYAKTKLGSDDHAVTGNGAQKAAQQFFIGVRPVDFGGVQKISSKFHVAVENAERFLFIGWPVGAGHAHAAESQGRNQWTVLSKLPVWHKFLLREIQYVRESIRAFRYTPCHRHGRSSFDTMKTGVRRDSWSILTC